MARGTDKEGLRQRELARLIRDVQPILRLQRELAPALELQRQLKPFLEMQRQWQRDIAPLIAMQKQILPLIEVQKQFALAPAWMFGLRNSALGALAAFQQAWQPLSPVMAEVARTDAECRRIEAAGWLPHYTTPFDALSDDESDWGGVLERHYLQNWPEVKAAFLSRLADYDIDEEAKATFAEALNAHEAGCYRSTTRSLFPEIERVVRCEFDDAPGRITSQHFLRDAAGGLYLSDVEPGGLYSLRLFVRLFDHLYAQARPGENLDRLAADPVPNRHAALHGLVKYETHRSSINMLIMTDFIFQVICALKRRAEEAAEEESDAA